MFDASGVTTAPRYHGDEARTRVRARRRTAAAQGTRPTRAAERPRRRDGPASVPAPPSRRPGGRAPELADPDTRRPGPRARGASMPGRRPGADAVPRWPRAGTAGRPAVDRLLRPGGGDAGL